MNHFPQRILQMMKMKSHRLVMNILRMKKILRHLLKNLLHLSILQMKSFLLLLIQHRQMSNLLKIPIEIHFH